MEAEGWKCRTYRQRITVEFCPSSGLGISAFHVVSGDGRSAVFLRRRPLDRDVVLVAVRHFWLARRVRFVCVTHTYITCQSSLNPETKGKCTPIVLRTVVAGADLGFLTDTACG